jgi:hypothetical protein
MKNQFATEDSACVVGASAPYNHGLPLAGTEITEKLAVALPLSDLFAKREHSAVLSVCSVFSVAKSF